METQNNSEVEHKNRSGKVIAGMVVIGIGTVLLARQMGVEIPYWVISWKMLLIVIGIYLGARQSFRNLTWLIPVAIGTIFLFDDIVPYMSVRDFVIPIIIILIGVVIMFKPKHSKDNWEKWGNNFSGTESTSENLMDSVAVFGSLKKNIITKDFKGGEVSLVFGGAEINLSQADINGKVVVELTQIFAGSKLIVPPHWMIKTDDLVCIFGGVEDKRQVIRQDATVDTNKILVLRGTCIFGGIDIKSF